LVFSVVKGSWITLSDYQITPICRMPALQEAPIRPFPTWQLWCLFPVQEDNMFRRLLSLLLALSALAANAAEKLPVRRVVLYKNGVGYFEHTGRVRGAQEFKIDFTSAQLNDVLKSLTVLDLNGGKISGVGYNSVAPIAEQLKSLRLPLDESTTLEGFLNALRGAPMEVRTGAAVFNGRLLSVEEKTTHKGEQETGKMLELSLIGEGGIVRTFPLTSAVSVRVADHDLSEEITKYLSLINSARDQDLRQMSIATSGTGERNVFVSYISEVPVWKSTYRIILPEKPGASPLLQGWAIVDNTVGEDWKDVELSLVAGAPQSFIEDLSRPYYTRRPVVALPQTAMLTPQTHEGTMEEVDLSAGSPMPGPTPAPPPAPHKASAQGFVGGGIGSGSAGGFGTSDRLSHINGPIAGPVTRADRFSLGVATEGEPGANAQELGDLFEYNLKEKVTILKNHSALVPIINSPIKAEKVTLWSRGSARPLRALWISNSSGLTLDGGTFNIIEDGAFAGEGLIDPLKPEERRLLSYAVDQGVRVEHKDNLESRPVTHIKIAKGVMVQTSEQRDHQQYVIRNTDTQVREVVIEHPVRTGWKLGDGLKPAETSASFYRFRMKVDAGKNAELKVDETRPLEQRIALSNVTDDQVRIWFNDKNISPELKAVLEKIVQKKNEIAGFEQRLQEQQEQIGSINEDQGRLRENMQALKGSAEERALLQRYTRELNDQEDKLQAVRGEMAKIEQQRADGKQQLDRMLQEITLDATI
jgi:hypothetical protein